ncbi:MAG: flagellar basal body protein [Undibacterium umbellatum]|uniref:flagellar basal body rod protein FlgB n=1 Tax=Undibacterium umbellatum TaxID=2762300 RepID=UPI003BB733EA
MANLPINPSLSVKSADKNAVPSQKNVPSSGASFAASLARLQEKVATTVSNTAATFASEDRNILGSVTRSSLPLAKAGADSSTPLVEMEENILHERALALRAYRQQLLASNIANADTPGYKAVDIDIQEAIRTGKTIDNVQIKYVMPSQGNVDGNTVEMDREMAKFTENALMYQYQVDRVRSHYKDMEELLKNTPY